MPGGTAGVVLSVLYRGAQDVGGMVNEVTPGANPDMLATVPEVHVGDVADHCTYG